MHTSEAHLQRTTRNARSETASKSANNKQDDTQPKDTHSHQNFAFILGLRARTPYVSSSVSFFTYIPVVFLLKLCSYMVATSEINVDCERKGGVRPVFLLAPTGVYPPGSTELKLTREGIEQESLTIGNSKSSRIVDGHQNGNRNWQHNIGTTSSGRSRGSAQLTTPAGN